jgi:hypothetical protein
MFPHGGVSDIGDRERMSLRIRDTETENELKKGVMQRHWMVGQNKGWLFLSLFKLLSEVNDENRN